MQRYYKGRKEPKNLQHLKQLSRLRHFARLAALPPATQPSWDSRTFGWVGPVKDQQQCGSCWDFSGTGVVEIAYNKAGIGGGSNVFILSEEYTLDCGQNGGCNGDDNTTVLSWAKKNGLPLNSAYGPYTAGGGTPGQCSWNPSMQLYKVDDWGFADNGTGNGVTPVQDIKNAIVAYGSVGCAIAADDAFQNNPPGTVFQGSGSTAIDHDIILVGWDDSKGAWLLRNSWGQNWCDGGYCWIAYGANLVGTEAVFAVVNAQPQPVPVPPSPTPTPIPPVPPLPPGPIGSGFSGTLTYSNGLLTSVTSNSLAAGSATSVGLNIPPGLLLLLKAACTSATVLPAPWNVILATVCALLPQNAECLAKGGQHVGITLPSWLLLVLQGLCLEVSQMPNGEAKTIATLLCSLLSPATSAKGSPCGCK